MATARIPVEATVLEWAIDRSGHRREDLSKKPVLSKLPEWLSGQLNPTLSQLEALSRATSTPLGYLLLKEPQEDSLSIPFYRTRTGTTPIAPSIDLMDTIRTMQERQDWLREFLLERGAPAHDFIGSASQGSQATTIANDIHSYLGTGSNWASHHTSWEGALRELRTRIDDRSIYVFVNGVVSNNTHRPLDPSEFGGFSLVDSIAPLIFLNGADAKSAQMFTLAHELAHLWYGSSGACGFEALHASDHDLELACDAVAAEFLVPASSHGVQLGVCKEPSRHLPLSIFRIQGKQCRHCPKSA